MKLFSITKIKENYYVKCQINILGIKVSYKYFNVEYRQFSKDYNNYLKNLKKYEKSVKDNITRRLFITSGNLSLINTLAIINQFNLKENCENSIFVWSHISNPEFEAVNEKISRMEKLKYYLTFFHCSLMDVYKYFIKNNLVEFDEIYFPNCKYMFEIVNFLFPNKKYYVIDEGVCVLVKHKGIDYSNAEKYIYAKYLNKIDILGADEDIKNKIISLNKDEFLKISKQCEKIYPVNINQYEKNIVFCGTTASLDYWTSEEISNAQNEIIQKLILKGYNVLFKPHPRDTFEYKENDKFKILNTKLPLECYSLKDKCLAVVSLFSSAVCQMYYYQGIAGFCYSDFLKNNKDIGINIIREYSPSVDMLLSIDANLKTFEELQKEIQSKYEEWINKKPLLSENDLLADLYNKIPPPDTEEEFCLKYNNISEFGNAFFLLE